MQLAYSLGEWRDPRAGQALADIAIGDADDPLMMAAVMSSATSFPARDAAEDPGQQAAHADPKSRWWRTSCDWSWNRSRCEPLARGLRRIATRSTGQFETWQYQVMAGLVDAIEYSGDSLSDLHERSAPELRAAIEATAGLFAAARRDVVDATLDPERRLQAVRLVGRGLERQADDVQLLADQLVASTPVRIQQTIVDVLGMLRPDDLPDVLLDQWAQHGPEIRPQILEMLLRQPQMDARTAGPHRRRGRGGERNRRRQSQQTDLAQFGGDPQPGLHSC